MRMYIDSMSLIASGCKEKTLPASLGKLKKEDTEIFNVKYHTAKQLRHFKYESVQILVALFTSTKFMTQVYSGFKEVSKSALKMMFSLD